MTQQLYDHCVECGNTKSKTSGVRCNSCAAKARWRNEDFRKRQAETHNSAEYKQKLSERAKKMWASPGYRERQAGNRKALWQTEQYRAKMEEIFASEQYRKKLSEAAKVRWADPEVRQRHGEQMAALWTEDRHQQHQEFLKELWDDPEYQRIMSEMMRSRWRDEGYRQKQSERSKANWQNPDYREHLEAIYSSPEYKQRLSAIRKAMYPDDLLSEYPWEFNESLREAVRIRDGRRCSLCNKTEDENGRKLDVHHIDFDKANNAIENLIALCISCHAKAAHNRSLWQGILAEMTQEYREGRAHT